MEKMIELMDAMKEKAEDAYLNGRIATARHISALSLEKCPDEFPLANAVWCFSILIRCYKNDTDHAFLSSQFRTHDGQLDEKSRFSNVNSNYGLLIEFLMEILKPKITNQSRIVWTEKLVSLDAIGLKDDISTALLLETIIEICCFYEFNEWEKIAKHFMNVTKASLNYASNQLCCTAARLSLQLKIIKGEFDKRYDFAFLSASEQGLARSWIAFYRSDFREADKLIPEMVKGNSTDSEYFLSVQGYINITRQSRYFAKDTENPIKPAQDKMLVSNTSKDSQGNIELHDCDDTLCLNVYSKDESDESFNYTDYYRFQRFATEHPLSAFFQIRESDAELTMQEIRAKISEKGSASSPSWRLIRIIPFIWADALRYWDLAGFQKTYEFQAEVSLAQGLYFEKEQYHGLPSMAIDAIINSIKALDTEAYKRPEAKLLIRMIDKYAQQADIEYLFKYIFDEAPPIAWPACIEWLELLSDLLPEELMPLCLKWITAYKIHLSELLLTINFSPFDFLIPILKNYRLTDKQNKSLLFYYENVLKNYHVDYTIFETVFLHLASWDLEMCQQYIQKLVERNEAPYDNASIINICMRLADQYPQLKDTCASTLIKRAESTGNSEYVRFANILDASIGRIPPNINAIIVAVKAILIQVTAKSYNSSVFSAFTDQIYGYDWDNVSTADFELILDAFTPMLDGTKPASPLYLADLFSAFARVFQSGPSSVQNSVAEAVLGHIEVYNLFDAPDKIQYEPLSNFRIDMRSGERMYNAFLFLFCQIYSGLNSPQKQKVSSICQQRLYMNRDNAYYETYLLIRISADSKEKNDTLSIVTLNSLIILAQMEPFKEKHYLTECLRGIHSFVGVQNITIKSEIVDFISTICKLGIDSVFYEDRVYTAKILRDLSDDQVPNRGNLLRQLSLDNRKSVRNAAKTEAKSI